MVSRAWLGFSVIPSDLMCPNGTFISLSYQEVVQLRTALEKEILRNKVLSCYFVVCDDTDILP